MDDAKHLWYDVNFQRKKIVKQAVNTWMLGTRAFATDSVKYTSPGTVLLDCGPLDLEPLNQVTEPSFSYTES